MSSQINPYPLRVDEELFEKFKIIAKHNSRSINKEIEFLIKQHVTKYELDNGEIIIDF